MADPFSNINESFKNAFEHWEAPHSASEMNAGWDKVAAHLPQVPAAHTPSVGHGAGHFASSLSKVIGFSGLGAAVVTSAVILYNIYVKPANPISSENGKAPAKTEQIVPVTPQNQNQAAANRNSNTSGQIAANGNLNQSKSLSKPDGTPIQGTIPGNAQQGDAFGYNPKTAPDNIAGHAEANPNPVKSNAGPANGTAQSMKLFISDTVICAGTQIAASSNMQIADRYIDWGDGKINQFSGQNTHVYNHGGRFWAHLLNGNETAERMVMVIEKPKARFTTKHDEQLKYQFSNSSVSGVSYSWNYGDGSMDENGYYASHTYQDTGRYKVRLIAMSTGGCADTTYQYINAQQTIDPQMTSNVITPNGDRDNDDVGVTIQGEIYYELTIMSDGGKVVFQTKDKYARWGGINQSTGVECPAGQYYYFISYSFKQNGESKIKKGVINLLRSKN